MSAPDVDRTFAGSIPRIYETYMVPMVFAPYAKDLSERVRGIPARRVLEDRASSVSMAKIAFASRAARAPGTPESSSMRATCFT